MKINYGLLLLTAILFFVSCAEETIEDELKHPFELKLSETSSKEMRTTGDLEKFAMSYLDGELQLKSITSCELEYIPTTNFYIIHIKGVGVDEWIKNIAIPLEGDLSVELRGGMLPIGTLSGCSHHCSVANMLGCTTSCDLVIHEACKRQSCSCKSGGSGGCDGMIIFR